MPVPIEPGLEATADHVVTTDDTASSLGSGDVDVYATPAVVALCESAAVAAVAQALDPKDTTVGTNITLDHLAPTQPGMHVTAHARLERVDERTLHFTVDASDPAGPIARGTHTRVMVDRERFLRGATDRSR
jgi:predicted thioesterase